jgi:hypothetical protein
MTEKAQKYDINVSIVFFLLGFLLFLSVMLVFDGLMSYQTDSLRAIMQVGAGIAGIAFVGYNLRKMQVRFSVLAKTPFGPRVITTQSCLNCNYSNVRPFREGDYIYGKGDPCPKCNAPDPMLIKAIFLQKPPKT